jgi:phosphatidylserine/phosphatidylglycerophosphate/cardiolipin synthase-like enzyme
LPQVIERADGLLGRSIEALVTTVHRWRLARVGWQRAYAPGDGLWAAGQPPPRHGNSLDILVDGSQALATMVEEIRAARSHVHVTGWQLSPEFVLTRGYPPVVLGDLLSEAARRVEIRVLLWAGAPVPVFRPSRNDMRKVRQRLGRYPRIQCALDSCLLPGITRRAGLLLGPLQGLMGDA